jgi:hypothetical protein
VNWELVNMDEIFPSESTFQVTRCTRTGSDLLHQEKRPLLTGDNFGSLAKVIEKFGLSLAS